MEKGIIGNGSRARMARQRGKSGNANKKRLAADASLSQFQVPRRGLN